MTKAKPKASVPPAPALTGKPTATRRRTSKSVVSQPPPPSPPAEPVKPATKLDILASLLGREEGATVDQLMAATGWRRHSVRGALAGAMKQRFGAKVTSAVVDGVRTYRAPQG